jgi:hypothetical protein
MKVLSSSAALRLTWSRGGRLQPWEGGRSRPLVRSDFRRFLVQLVSLCPLRQKCWVGGGSAAPMLNAAPKLQFRPRLKKKRQAKSDIEHIKEVINAPFYGQCPLNLIIVQIEVQGTN